MSENLSQKEILIRMMDQMDKIDTATTVHAEHAKNVDKHLAALNSKVAVHEKKFSKFETFQTKVMTTWGIVTFATVTIINKLWS